jgi:hypothetical protein
VLSELRDASARVPDWPLEREGFGALAPGFKRIYRRGRRAYRAARREPSTENLHELRKRTKDPWYAAQIVTLVERRGAELRKEAMDVAKQLFRKKPRKLVRSLEKAGVSA